MMTIVSLSFACGPLAVTGLVIAIVVYALNGQITSWSFSHIRKEVPELLPAFADFDSASSVAMEVFDLWIGASLNHCPPDPIFWGMTPAMRSQSICADLAMQATAGLSVCASQAGANDHALITAGATAQPRHFFTHFPEAPQNGQSAERFPRQIYQLHQFILDNLRGVMQA